MVDIAAISGMYGWWSSYKIPIHISVNTYSQHNVSWWPHPILTTSSRFHHHACNSLEGVGLDGTILDSSSDFGSGRFWSNANLHICLGIGANLRGLLGLFFGAKLSFVRLWGVFFFGGEASTGLGECDPEYLQFLFSGSRVVPCWGFVSMFCIACEDWGMLLIQRGCKRLSEFSEQVGDYIQLGNQLHILVIMCPAYHMPSMHMFCCVGSNLFRTCALTCLFSRALPTCALPYQIKCLNLR